MPGYGSYKAPETEEAPIDWGSVNAEYEAAQKVTFKFNFFSEKCVYNLHSDLIPDDARFASLFS